VFGKANGSVVNLSAIASASNPLGGFVINGEAASNYSGGSVKEPLSSLMVSLLIRKPPMPAAIADKSMAVPSCLPKTTYALPSLFESRLIIVYFI
jgi:hypothetical protein